MYRLATIHTSLTDDRQMTDGRNIVV